MTQQETTPQAAIKKFLRDGVITDSDSVLLAEVPLSFASAVALRRMAIADTEPSEQRNLRAQSREALAGLNEVDLEVLDQILTSEVIDKDLIVGYLKARNVTQIPLLSSLPPDVRSFFLAHFSEQIIPAGQMNITDFGNTVTSSEIPDWFRDAETAKRENSEHVGIFTAMRERWFIILTFLLGLMTAYGFQNNLGINLPDFLGQIDIFLSLYGVVAVTRSVVQIERAEDWLMQTRGETRGAYSDAFDNLLNPTGFYTDPSSNDYNLGIEKLITRVKKISRKQMNWDPYQDAMGLRDPEEKKPLRHPSVLEELNQIRAENNAEPINRDTYLNTLAQTVIKQNFGDQPPTVAVMIPTYQTSLKEMEGLLASIKDQAYPVTHVFVVYNDNPNDPHSPAADGQEKVTKKQAEFHEIQALVDHFNQTSGRNNCQIILLAQHARGKREAMAMGAAMGLGNTYLDDLQKKYPNVDPEKLRYTIGNVDIKTLPDRRHDYILNIDSDTQIRDPFAILNGLILMYKHPDAAATTGDVRVKNRDVNMLSEMTFQRYWKAFFVERAAQKDGVTCDSGPFVLMRHEALAGILEEWYYQEEGSNPAVRSTFGDDRHLTTLFLRGGYKSLFSPDSAVETDSPIEWKTFMRQQLRWNKSFNRENLILMRGFIHKLSLYDQFDIVYQQTFPFAMLYILSSIISKGIGVGLEDGAIAGAQVMTPYIFTIIAYNELFSGIYGMLKNKDPKFLLSPVYIDYHFGALLWLKLRAIAERKDTTWGTKGMTVEAALNEFELEKGRIIYEIHEQIVTEVQNPNWNPDLHVAIEIEGAV